MEPRRSSFTALRPMGRRAPAHRIGLRLLAPRWLNHLGFGAGDLRTEGNTVDETGRLDEPPVAGVRTVDGAVVVSLVGELDLYNAHVVRERLTAAADDGGGERLVVDLSGVTFIDSTGLGVLVETRSRLANRRA